jgi:hypothetical protein
MSIFERKGTGSGGALLAGIKDAIDGDFVRVTVEGQTWVRLNENTAIVPIEPTDEMLRAGLRVSRSSDYEADDTIGAAIWRAMLGACGYGPARR